MKYLLAIVAAAGFAAPAFAQAPDFATADADQDGVVTFEELQTAMPDVTQESFDEADADDSGDLSEDEFTTITSM